MMKREKSKNELKAEERNSIQTTKDDLADY
jgi:hypothetical protein